MLSRRSWRCGCLLTWFCYQLIAKPGNKTAAPPWPDPYGNARCITRNHSGDGFSQLKMMLLCSIVSHWLSPYPEIITDYWPFVEGIHISGFLSQGASILEPLWLLSFHGYPEEAHEQTVKLLLIREIHHEENTPSSHAECMQHFCKLIINIFWPLLCSGSEICQIFEVMYNGKIPEGHLAIRETRALSYYNDLTLSQYFQSMAAVLPLAKILVTTSCRSSKTGPWALFKY